MIPLRFETEVLDTTLRLEPGFLVPPIALAALALLLLAGTSAASADWRATRLRSLLLAAFGAFFVAGVALLAWILPAPEGSALRLMGGPRDLLVALGAAGLGAAVLGSLEALERLLDERPAQPWLALQLALGLATAAWSGHAGLTLARLTPVPYIVPRGCEVVHPGLPCTPDLELFALGRTRSSGGIFRPREDHLIPFTGSPETSRAPSFQGLKGWTVPGLTVQGEAPGDIEVEVTATHARMSATKRLQFKVGEETGDPLFDPQPGATWRYRRFAEVGGERVAIFLRSRARSRHEQEPLVARVLDEQVVQGGLRMGVMEVDGRRLHLLRLDGQTTLVDPDTGQRRAALYLLDDDTPLDPWTTGLRRASTAPARRCRVAWLPEGMECVCPLEVPEGALPGPDFCVDVDEVSRGVGILAGVLSVGMVAIGADRQVLVLDEARAR